MRGVGLTNYEGGKWISWPFRLEMRPPTTTKRRGRCPHRPAMLLPHRLSQRPGRREWPGGRGRPPLQFVFGNVIQKAGRIISAPTFTHTFSKRPGRRGRRPLQFVPADDVGSSGRPRAASPTIRFRKRHSKGRADNIRPYISAHIFQTAGTSRTPSPTIHSGRCCRNGREAEGGLPYNWFNDTFSIRCPKGLAPTISPSHIIKGRDCIFQPRCGIMLVQLLFGR